MTEFQHLRRHVKALYRMDAAKARVFALDGDHEKRGIALRWVEYWARSCGWHLGTATAMIQDGVSKSGRNSRGH